MQFQIRECGDFCHPPARRSYPRVEVEEHRGAPLLSCAGVALIRDLIKRLGWPV